jgi:hypothetical protein
LRVVDDRDATKTGEKMRPMPYADVIVVGAGPTGLMLDLMRTARPILLDLADRPDLREAAQKWRDRVDIVTAETDHRPADALLIRPDGYIAWAAASDEHVAAALREALSHWFGSAVATTAIEAMVPQAF